MILTIGNINVDLICQVPRLPSPDDKVIVSNLDIVPGGGACNFAVGLSRLGSKVALFGHVGDDQNGKSGLDSLKKENVDIGNVIIEKDHSTGFVIILVDKSGQTIKIGYREANALLSPKEITKKLLEEFSLVHLSSVSAPVALKVAEICKNLGIESSIDFGGELMNQSSEVLLKIVEAFSMVFMNRIAFEKTFNCKPNKEGLKIAQSKKIGILNVTIGERGSYIVTRRSIIDIPAWDVPVIDTTGAGDAYAAGFIHYFHEGSSLHEVGKKAAACAALQITLSNARDGMPMKEDVEEFIRNKNRT